MLARAIRSVAFNSLKSPSPVVARRGFCSAEDLLSSEREYMEYDVLIVGAGPAGLSAAIRLKQLESETGQEISVCVVEKGAEVGSHIISGNVLEPRALKELIPNFKELGAPVETEAGEDQFLYLTEKSSFKAPLLPPTLHNDGNYIISLGQLVRWLGEQAEELGVEIYPGFSASEVLYDQDGSVSGIATCDVGIGKDGAPKDTFARGMELRARQTMFAEGCRGSCSEEVMQTFNLRENCDPQSYGLGLKEVWEIPEEKCKPGFIQHSIGWPMDHDTYAGSFLYHMAPNKVLLGYVVGLDYKNPYLSPYETFQQFKHHPDIAKHLEDGECIAYGARCLNEGGFQSIPKLTFPGGMLIGCSAGFLNVPKIKGTHTAMKSGMVAAEAAFSALSDEDVEDISASTKIEVTGYQTGMENSWVWEELRSVRNYAPSFKYGLLGGVAYSGLSGFILRGNEPWTLCKSDGKHDSEKTKKASECQPIEYPKPDGVLSFDLLSNLQRSGTYHEDDQPAHLRVKPDMEDTAVNVSLAEYAGPEQRFCPARVYEYHTDDETGKEKLVINAQNCIHCKCCSIKMPCEYIKWTVPEGAGGPSYEVM